MSYQYLEHEADMGIKAAGETKEEAFAEAARAMFNLMVNSETVIETKEIRVEVEAQDIASLFVEWLNELLSRKDIEGCLYKDFKVESIVATDGTIKLFGYAYGEPFDAEKHELKTEVKAATYSGLKCGWEKDGQFYCQCLLDV
jgi:SHS2 domain-containing protein